MKQEWMGILTNILYGVIGAAIFTLFSHWFSPPAKPIAVVNLTGLVNGYVKQVAKSNVQRDVASQKIKEFANDLEKNIKEMSKKKGVVIMPAEAVIAGSPNLTNELIHRLPALKNLQNSVNQTQATNNQNMNEANK